MGRKGETIHYSLGMGRDLPGAWMPPTSSHSCGLVLSLSTVGVFSFDGGGSREKDEEGRERGGREGMKI